MTKLSRGISYLLTLTVLFVIVSTLSFYLGMNHLEGQSVSILESLEFVTQTMTTVGYGQHATWDTAPMHILAIVTEIAGIALVFMSIPIVVTPWIQERITLQPPTEYDGPGNHLIITEYTDLMDTLLDELEGRDIPYVLIDDDQDTASRLLQEDRHVMLGDTSEPETLEKARLNEARLGILDGPDERSAMVALAMDEYDPEFRVVAVAGQTDRATHLSQAGVDKVIYPRRLIGEELARHALKAVGKEFDINDPDLNEELDIREFPVVPSSPLGGKTLEDSALRNNFGIHVVGIWRRGEFINNPDGTFRFRKGDILVATGSSRQLDDLEEHTEISKSTGQSLSRDCLIIGFGNEGEAAREKLMEAGIEPTVLNDVEDEHVDVVGNGMDPDTLKEANADEAETILITISADEVAVMVTLMVRRINPRAEILVQVNQEFAVEPIYRAGANYVQSLTLITGRMLAGEALGEDLLSPELNIKIRHCGVGSLVGQTLEEASIARKHDVSIIALRRNGVIQTNVTPDLTFEEGDEIYICGNDDNVNEFAKYFDLTDPKN